jgi:hypothetical protein
MGQTRLIGHGLDGCYQREPTSAPAGRLLTPPVTMNGSE